MQDERELVINPIVQESLAENARLLGNIRSLSASLFGITAGTLRLESFAGFAFYLIGTLFVSLLIFLGPAKRDPDRFFWKQGFGLWIGDIGTGVLSFVLTWTLLYNLVGS